MDTQEASLRYRSFSLPGTKIEEGPRRGPEPEAYSQSHPFGVGNGPCPEDSRQSYVPSESGSSDEQKGKGLFP